MSVSDSERQFLQEIDYLHKKDRAKVEEALDVAKQSHAGQMRDDGTPYAEHLIEVARILAGWQADAETIIAGLLHDSLEDTQLQYPEIAQRFGDAVAVMVQGVTKFTQADFAQFKSLDRKIETLRKLFEVMRSDIRVALIKLADRLHNVRTIDSFAPERRTKFARESLQIYYPIAEHLGLHQLRRELSERCMEYAFPEDAAAIRQRRESDVHLLQELLPGFERRLRAADSEESLIGLRIHPRSQYAIYREQQHTSEQAKDMAYVVVIGSTTDACYTLLKLLHTLFHPLSGRFRDFIAAPRDNGYQSLHTAILDTTGALIPVRIRTKEMDMAEKRAPIHLLLDAEQRRQHYPWLERSENLDTATRESSNAFWEALQSDIFQESIRVTVNGKSLSIPRGATALDATYAALGTQAHSVRQISVNGSTRPAATPLEEDDFLQVQLGEVSQVTFDWLRNVVTRYARSLIATTLREHDQREKLLLGRRLLQHELDYFQKGLLSDISRSQQQTVAMAFGRQTFDEVLTMISEGVIDVRDVVFQIFPEDSQATVQAQQSPAYSFRLRIRGVQYARADILSQITGLARIHGSTIQNTQLDVDRSTGLFDLVVHGVSDDRLHFTDFLSALERHEGVSRIDSLLSRQRRMMLLGSLFLCAAVVFFDVMFLPIFHRWVALLPTIPSMILQILPLLPIFIANHYFLRILMRSFVWIRTSRWLLAFAFLLNILGIIMVILRADHSQSLLPVTAAFVLSMLYMGYRFFEAESLFTEFQTNGDSLINAESPRQRLRRKITGYLFRTCAVIVWGIQPLYLKYTPANVIEPFTRLYLMGVGAFLSVVVVLLIRFVLQPRHCPHLRIPWSIYLFNIILGQAVFLYLISASLRFTTSTNFILFNNFAPVLALVIAAIFWRSQIRYLQDPRHLLWIFIIFLLGSTGSSLIIFHSTQSPEAGTLIGDLLGILAMTFDTLLIISQIRYITQNPSASGLSINLHMFAFLTLILSPPMLYLLWTQPALITSLSAAPVFYSLGAGTLLVVGLLLNFEAFRRIDGFIAFLMFNISIFIAFIVEVYVLHTFEPTWALLLGGLIIIGSTVAAEYINSRSEKQVVAPATALS